MKTTSIMRYKARKKKQGFCTVCGGRKAKKGRTLCEICLDKQRARWQTERLLSYDCSQWAKVVKQYLGVS